MKPSPSTYSLALSTVSRAPSVMLTMRNWTSPSSSSQAALNSGISLLQGEHQLAQKLSTMGLPT